MSDILYHATTVSELRARTLKVGDTFTLPADSNFTRVEQKPTGDGVPCFIEAAMTPPDEPGQEFIVSAGTNLTVTAVRLKMSESQDNTAECLRVKVELDEGGAGSGNFSHAGRPGEVGGSGPGGGQSPAKDWQDPPSPGKGRDPSVRGGMTATGETNTKIGDLGERLLVKQLGMKSLIPAGQRKNPLDVRWDNSQEAYEVKTITTDAKEFKIKMKAAEVESKLKYAKAHSYKAGMIMLVIDRKTNTGYAYKREGIGNYRLNNKDWTFMGKVRTGEKAKEGEDMSVMLRTKTNDYDLGGTIEFLQFEQELALLANDGDKTFPHVGAIVDQNEEEVSADWIKACAAEAQEALKLYGQKLSDHAQWVLGELAGLHKE